MARASAAKLPMILEPNSHFEEPYEEDMSGISLTPEEIGGTKLSESVKSWRTHQDQKPAYRSGDLVTAIDGQPAATLTEGHIERMFIQPAREFSLSIKRGDKELIVRLKLRRLI